MKKILFAIFLAAVTSAWCAASIIERDTLVRRQRVLTRDTVVEYDTIVVRRTVIEEKILLPGRREVLPAHSDTVSQRPTPPGAIPADTLGPETVAAPLVKRAKEAGGMYALFRGDTVPMLLRDRNLGRFDRGLSNHLYIPRGMWQFGITASYGEFSTDDLEVLDLLSDIDIDAHIFSVKPYFSYFIRNNMSVGMRLGYTSGKGHIGSFKLDIDDDMNFDLHDISYRSESYTAAVMFRQYYGIARRGRFGIFNEVELAFGSGNSDFVRPYGGKLRATHTTSMDAALNFSPGLSVFVMEKACFNISFGVFGFNVRHDKQTEDGLPAGERTTSGANFRFNIFNINFGLAVTI